MKLLSEKFLSIFCLEELVGNHKMMYSDSVKTEIPLSDLPPKGRESSSSVKLSACAGTISLH